MPATDPHPKISFFVPCLNEEGNVGRAIDTIVEVMTLNQWSYEIIVVDDASSDKTVEEVHESQRRQSQVPIHLLINRFTRGLGRNYFIASHHAKGEHFMIVSGDGSQPVAMIHAVVSQLGKSDAIVPYFGSGETRVWARKMLSRCFT